MIELNIPTGSQPAHYEFPVIDGKSPNTFKLVNNTGKDATVTIIIEKLGGLADENYK